MAENISLRRPFIASVRPGVFRPREIGYEGTAALTPINVFSTPNCFHLLRCLEEAATGIAPERADIVFSGGLGMGSARNFSILEELAVLTGGGVGASRAAVTAGYAPYFRQIGQTGHVIRPKLYLAFGISGAVQHLSGILGAGTIIAVNRDEKAPIRRCCELFIHNDCIAFAEQLRDK